jgi:hypothetical protein
MLNGIQIEGIFLQAPEQSMMTWPSPSFHSTHSLCLIELCFLGLPLQSSRG